MYLWKSWHDSRHRIVLYAGACMAIGAMIGLDVFGWYIRDVAWIAASTNPRIKLLNPSPWAWSLGMSAQTEFMLPIVIWAALALGATSAGREYGSGAMAFVLTRPQSRWRIVWGDWLLGVSEICIILSMLTMGMTPFLFLTSRIYVGFNGALIPGALAVGACLYGLTQFLTMLTGSSMKGTSAAVASILFYLFLPSALDDWWHIKWPQKVVDLSLSVFEEEWYRLQLPSWGVTILWAMLALIFPLLSQWLIERREV